MKGLLSNCMCKYLIMRSTTVASIWQIQKIEGQFVNVLSSLRMYSFHLSIAAALQTIQTQNLKQHTFIK